jgi:PAT family beta-lactamase induction signal transducer AmpG
MDSPQKPETPQVQAQAQAAAGADPRWWVFSTYFAQGFPYMVVRSMSAVFFTDVGMSERALGYLNFLGLPWTLKFVWAPLVDLYSTRRAWMISVQILLTLLTALLAGLCLASAEGLIADLPDAVLVWIFVAMAFIAATNDIAIDGYYMEGITDPKQQAAYTGFRVTAYRLAMILARFGIILAVAEVAQTVFGGNMYGAWGFGFAAGAAVMAILTALHLLKLPRYQEARARALGAREAAAGFLDSFAAYLEVSRERTLIALLSAPALAVAFAFALLALGVPDIQAMTYAFAFMLIVLLAQARPAIALSLAFIMFYKIGDEIIFSMGTPFLKRYLLVDNTQLAWMSGLLGLVGSIVGTTIGGLWIKRTGLRRAIWPLTLLMNLNILAYIWLAWERPLATDLVGLLTICAVYTIEQIAAGLGNAVLIVYILRTCKPEFKAGHYAIGSAFMSVFSALFGGMGGVIVEGVGYLGLFIIGFLASIPAMALLFFVRVKD